MEWDAIGSSALRILVKTLRKQGHLCGHTAESAAQVGSGVYAGSMVTGLHASILNSENCKGVTRRAIANGGVKIEKVNALAAWAKTQAERSGKSPAPADTQESEGKETMPQEAAFKETPPLPTLDEVDVADVAVPTPAPQIPVNGAVAPALRDALLGLLGDAIRPAAVVDEETVRKIVEKAITDHGALRVEIVRANGEIKAVPGRTHKLFPILCKMIAASDNAQRKLVAPFLVGPAGSGKTQACAQAAEALGLRFFSQSVCSQTTASVLMGYYDANGKYVRSIFREAYENGGLYLLDELDAGNPNVLAVLNAALSNGHCAFPDGMVARHDGFRCVAAGNTYGSGRTVEYVGRNPIDAATGNRFVKVTWPYDEKLERDICPNPEWAIYVQKWRASLARRGVKHILSPRQSLDGALLMGAGIETETVIETVLTAGMDEETAKAIREEVGAFNG